MSFSSTASLVSTDLDNTLRGFYRDNSDHAVTGTVAETDMASTTVTGGTIGPTGCLHISASGTSSGAGGTKAVKLSYGSATPITLTVSSGTKSWRIDCWLYNTSSTTQRFSTLAIEGTDSTSGANVSITANTSSIDSASNQTLKFTCTLASSGDTLTQKTFDVFQAQIQ